jgi:hypothetical protein
VNDGSAVHTVRGALQPPSWILTCAVGRGGRRRRGGRRCARRDRGDQVFASWQRDTQRHAHDHDVSSSTRGGCLSGCGCGCRRLASRRRNCECIRDERGGLLRQAASASSDCLCCRDDCGATSQQLVVGLLLHPARQRAHVHILGTYSWQGLRHGDGGHAAGLACAAGDGPGRTFSAEGEVRRAACAALRPKIAYLELNPAALPAAAPRGKRGHIAASWALSWAVAPGRSKNLYSDAARRQPI